MARASSVLVRGARPDEWEQSRALRLEMLADSPHAFLDRLEAVERWDDDRWRARLLSHLAPDSTVAVGVDGDRWVGHAAGRVFGGYDDGPRAYLLAMYVTPAHRGTGLAARLVAEVAAWAHAVGHGQLWLDVHEDATAARHAYARLGFVETGSTGAYPNDPARREIEMVAALPLDRAPS